MSDKVPQEIIASELYLKACKNLVSAREAQQRSTQKTLHCIIDIVLFLLAERKRDDKKD